MALLVPDAGEAAMLDNLLKVTSPEALVLKLYSNNYDAVESSTATNFTEATIAGYTAKSLTRAGWNSATTTGGVTTSTYGTPQVFNFTGTGNVVGYYLVGATSGTIYWAERLFNTTGQAFNNGDSLTCTIKMGLD